jgi:hypothetical protein
MTALINDTTCNGVDTARDIAVDNWGFAVDTSCSSTEPQTCYPRSVDNPWVAVDAHLCPTLGSDGFVHNPQDLLPPLLFESHTLRKRIRL